MQYYFQENKKPSDRTLDTIRQIAYSYRVANINGKNEVYSLN